MYCLLFDEHCLVASVTMFSGQSQREASNSTLTKSQKKKKIYEFNQANFIHYTQYSV